MKKTHNWLILTFLLVAVLVLGGCIKTSPTTGQEKNKPSPGHSTVITSTEAISVEQELEEEDAGESDETVDETAGEEEAVTEEQDETTEEEATEEQTVEEQAAAEETPRSSDEIIEEIVPIPTGTVEKTSAMTQGEILVALQENLNKIYREVNPSVVNIQVIQRHSVSDQMHNMPFEVPQDKDHEFFVPGVGSGFIWDTEGHIVTNNHVVQGAERISVTFYDGSMVDGTVIGSDPDSDLAVVKVDNLPEEIRPIQVTDSFAVDVGDLVVAIGNPFGLESTMTVGFVSAIGRSLPVETMTVGPSYSIPYIIQSDASINPGNSGGVMVDLNGLLIGVPSAIRSPVQASVGIGFAIPSAIVQKVVPVLIEQGHYEHPWLGIMGQSLTPDIAEAMGLPADQRGALVLEAVAGGPSEEAGIRGSTQEVTIEGVNFQIGGDVVIAFDGNPVQEFDDLIKYLARYTTVGQSIVLTVLREGNQQDIIATLKARPIIEKVEPVEPTEPMWPEGSLPEGSLPEGSLPEGSPEALPGHEETHEVPGTEEVVPSSVWLGIEGKTLTAAMAEEMGLSPEQQGVLVIQAVLDSPAGKANLRGSTRSVKIEGEPVSIGGDVITAMDDQAIKNLEDLIAFLQTCEPGQKIELTVLRGKSERSFTVTLEPRP